MSQNLRYVAVKKMPSLGKPQVAVGSICPLTKPFFFVGVPFFWYLDQLDSGFASGFGGFPEVLPCCGLLKIFWDGKLAF